MKLKAILFLIIIGFALNSFCQTVDEVTVPNPVKKALFEKFKISGTPDWTLDNDIYSVDFFVSDKYKGTASFNKDGSFIKSDVEIDLTATPEAIKNYVSNNFNGLKIEHVRQMLSKNKEENSYYVDASKVLADKKKYDAELTLSEEGTLISENIPNQLQAYRIKPGAAAIKKGPAGAKGQAKTNTADKAPKPSAKEKPAGKQAEMKKPSMGNDESIPEAVTDHFIKTFKQPGEVKWENNDNGFVANFSFKGQKSKAFYTKDGNYDKFQSEVSPSAAPPTVQKTLTTNYKDFKVISIENTITADKQKFYEIQLADKNDKKKSLAKTVYTNMGGQVVKETSANQTVAEDETKEVASNTIPETVRKTFALKYAKVMDVKWEKVENSYIASFFFKGDKNEAEYDEYGNWIKTTKSMAFAKLPPPVQNFISDKYKGEKILKSQFIETLDKQKYFYVETKTEARKKTSAKINKIKLTAAGKPLEQVTEDENASEVPFQPAVEEQPKQSKPEKVKKSEEPKQQIKENKDSEEPKPEKVKKAEKPKQPKMENKEPDLKPGEIKEEKNKEVEKPKPVKKEPVLTPEQEAKAKKKAEEEQKKMEEKAKKEEEKRLKKKQKEDADIEKELEKDK